MIHTRDPQRRSRRSLSDRHAVYVHGQYGLELRDEHRGDHGDADARRIRRPATIASRISSIPTPIIRRWSPIADLILPDTTYLERYDCISLLDRPISDAEAAADAIRQPVIKPDRDVRPFQDVLIELGARLQLPGLINADGTPKYPGLYPDYIVNHQRSPGVGLLAGWRGANGGDSGTGAVNPRQLERYIENECFWRSEMPEEARYFKPWNAAYLNWATEMGFLSRAEPIFIQLYSETLQKFRLAARGHGTVPIPARHRARVDTYFDPLPIWYAPFGEAECATDYGFHAITQRPMAMYHSWGSQNAWLRQIHGENLLHINRATARELGIADGDWVTVTSAHSTITVMAKLMDGVNPNTVWTWNAIGKRSGAWNLAANVGRGDARASCSIISSAICCRRATAAIATPMPTR